MNNNNSRTAHKTGILVEIFLDDGTTLFGKIFVPPKGRVTDLLNDERGFLPFEGRDGNFLALSKAAIRQVSIPAAEAVYQGTNPYLILGVEEGVTQEELKKAYHKLSLVNHPDRIKGLGLGADFQELATHNMARISNAYAQISRQLRNVGDDASSADYNSVN